MNALEELGFLRRCIVEAIVTTYDEAGQPNGAPMGISTEDLQTLLIRPYVDTTTYRNLTANPCAVVNLTMNPELFYRTAFKGAEPGGRLPISWFEEAEAVNAPRLKGADAFIEVSVSGVSQTEGGRALMKCNPQLVKVVNQKAQAYCRALFATLESIVHATRVEAFLSAGRLREAKELTDLIEHYRRLVDRVAPRSSYAQTMGMVGKRLELWRDQIEGKR